jgi:hypothetical protein
MGPKAMDAKKLAYRGFEIATQKKWSAEALVYNKLVQEWTKLEDIALNLEPFGEQILRCFAACLRSRKNLAFAHGESPRIVVFVGSAKGADVSLNLRDGPKLHTRWGYIGILRERLVWNSSPMRKPFAGRGFQIDGAERDPARRTRHVRSAVAG